MQKNRSPMHRKVKKLTASQLRTLKNSQSEWDILQDAREAYQLFTNILLGAMVEPERDAEAWVRRQLRDHIALNLIHRARTLQIIYNAQHSESAFQYLRERWEKMDLTKAQGTDGHWLDNKIIMLNYDEPVIKNI